MAILIILAGFILRIIFPLERVFHFDQEQIAVAAVRILEGHLTLIGPIACRIKFFTGPLIYYLSAVFFWLTQGHPLAATLTTAAIYLITSICLWLILKLTKIKNLALIFICLYSFSPHLTLLDRITWDPNFSYLSGALVLSALLFPLGKINNWMGFIGMWLAYQAHFAGFILAVAVTAGGLWLKRRRLVFFSLAGLIVSLLPTVIFDLRHDWLNTLGLWEMVHSPQQVAGGPHLFTGLFQAILISGENLIKIIIPGLPRWSLIGSGMLIFGLWWLRKKSVFNRNQRIILTGWILMFPLVIMFYRGQTPEYYYLMQLPAFGFIYADLLLQIKSSRWFHQVIIIGLFLLSLGSVIADSQGLASGASLRSKLQALKYIKINHPGGPVSLVMDMEVKDRFGWQYLLDYLQIYSGDNPVKTHLIFPVKPGAILTARFGGIGVWFDRRDTVDAQAFIDNVNGLMIYYPNDYWHLELNQPFKMQAFTPQNLAGQRALDAAILYFYLPKNENQKYLDAVKVETKPGELDRWQEVELIRPNPAGRKTLARERLETLFVFSFPPEFSWEEIIIWLNRLEGIWNG